MTGTTSEKPVLFVLIRQDGDYADSPSGTGMGSGSGSMHLPGGLVKRIVFTLVALLIAASPAFAQAPAKVMSGVSFSNGLTAPVATAVPAAAAAHKGFTFLLDGGFGMQQDPFFGTTAMGYSGLNVGAGWFIADNLAVMFRWTGTLVNFKDFDNTKQAAGVIGGVIQWWVNDRFAVEVGAGNGRWHDKDDDGFESSDNGFGLIFGGHFVVWQGGANHILVGFEYTPILTEDKIHSFAITGGYQWGKKK